MSESVKIVSREPIWTNTNNGNNHSLDYCRGEDDMGYLQLTVRKPDGTEWVSEPRFTLNDLSFWQRALAGVGMEWNQETSSLEGRHFKAVRSVTVQGAKIVWRVNHDFVEGKYVILDQFHVAED